MTAEQWQALRERWSRKARIATAYQTALLAGDRETPTAAGSVILADLRAFCRADASCVVLGKDGRIDTHATAVAEGRREVWLRLIDHLRLDAQTVRAIGDDPNG
jgi:hypothetical protein